MGPVLWCAKPARGTGDGVTVCLIHYTSVCPGRNYWSAPQQEPLTGAIQPYIPASEQSSNDAGCCWWWWFNRLLSANRTQTRANESNPDSHYVQAQNSFTSVTGTRFSALRNITQHKRANHYVSDCTQNRCRPEWQRRRQNISTL